MNRQGKVWGCTSELFNKNNVEIYRIEGRKGGYCSVHKHEHKHNMFFVESGMMKIKVWKNDYDLVDETILKDQEMSIVQPGEFHQFEVMQDTIAYEIYWTNLESSDIIRKDSGGMK